MRLSEAPFALAIIVALLAGSVGPVRNRISWHDNSDGTVRQHWETSADAGKSWQTAFDGLYRKKQ